MPLAQRRIFGVILIVVALLATVVSVEVADIRGYLLEEAKRESSIQFLKRIQEGGAFRGGGGGQGQGSSESSQLQDQQLILLTVSVFEQSSAGVRRIRGAMVNITVRRLVTEEMPISEEFRFEQQLPTEPVLRDIAVASGLTNSTGSISFRLVAGNYTVLAEHIGIRGNITLTLDISRPRVNVRWTFTRFPEQPLLIQFGDLNGNGIIEPGEPVVVFYSDPNIHALPNTIDLLLVGKPEVIVRMVVLSVTALPHGFYVTLTPTVPISIAQLSGFTSIVLIVYWYTTEVSP